MQMTGVLGDLNEDLALNEMDRTALMDEIASPTVTHYDLIGAPQHIFDLNADDFINALDLQVFNTKILPPAGLDGDYNVDGKVDAADYTVWRNNLGDADESALNGNGDGMNGVDEGDYTLWKSQFGQMSGPGAGAATSVPEPSAMLLVFLGMAGLVGLRRRTS
jgi:hypothetical protein